MQARDGRRLLALAIVAALARAGGLGCADPEPYRARGGVASSAAGRVNQTGTTRSTNWWQIGELQVVCAR